MSNTARFLLALFIIALFLALFAAFMVATAAEASTDTTAIGEKYPPGVAAAVKLKNSVTYPAGRTMPQWRTIRVQRNISNAYRANRSCPGINSLIAKTGYYSRQQEHGLAMVYARYAINRSYQCHDAQWHKENVR